MVVHRNDVRELRVVVGGQHGSVVVDVRALNGGIDVFVAPTDDHVDLGGRRELPFARRKPQGSAEQSQEPKKPAPAPVPEDDDSDDDEL